MKETQSIFGDEEETDEALEEQPSPPAAPAKKDFNHQGNNPVTSRGVEEMVERVPGTPEPPPVIQLQSVFGSDGKVRVALFVDGVQMEPWRQPSPKEWELLKMRGRLVKGGIAQTPAPAAASSEVLQQQQSPQAMNVMPKLLLGGLALLGAGAAFYFWRQSKQMDENVEEVE
jgi:hypothetical protein